MQYQVVKKLDFGDFFLGVCGEGVLNGFIGSKNATRAYD